MRRPENSCWPGCELHALPGVEASSRASLAAVMGLEWRMTFVYIPTRGSESIQVFVVMGSSFCDVSSCNVHCDTSLLNLSSNEGAGDVSLNGYVSLLRSKRKVRLKVDKIRDAFAQSLVCSR